MLRPRNLSQNAQIIYPKSFRILALICFFFLVACTEKNLEIQSPTATQKIALTNIDEKYSNDADKVSKPETTDSIQAILATTDLSIGKQRVAFTLISQLGNVLVPQVTVSSQMSSENHNVRKPTTAQFHPWPNNSRGLYVAEMDFPRHGDWTLKIEVPWPNGTTKFTHLKMKIKEESTAPMVGSLALKSITKTIHQTNSFTELTSGNIQDPDFYQLTLAEAIGNGRPTIVVFTSPAFCSTPFCGPQLKILRDIKLEFKHQLNFIHVDYYESPHLILGDLNNAAISKTVLEWNLPDPQWTFLIDHKGTITHRYQGFVNLRELNQSLQETLQAAI